MGNAAGKGALKPKEVAKLSTSSGFEPDHVKMLYAQFLSLKGIESPAAAGGGDLAITLPEFQAALGYKRSDRSVFVERIFHLFDEDTNGFISFEEFLHGIGVFAPSASSDVKLKFTFQVFDVENKGGISVDDLHLMLSAMLAENDIKLLPAQIERLVNDTFAQFDTDRNGFIDFEEYKNMCAAYPSVLKPLSLNVADLIKQAEVSAVAAGAAAGGAGGKAKP